MLFCFLYNVVLENYSVQNSPWARGGSIASSRFIPRRSRENHDSISFAIFRSGHLKFSTRFTILKLGV